MTTHDRTRLFRTEALEEQGDRWLGTVLLAPALPYTWLAGAAAVVLAGIVALVAFGEYTRKVRLGGVLVPERGLITVVVPAGGVVREVTVAEGEKVAVGDRLAVISTERSSAAVGATGDAVVRQLRAQRESLSADLDRQAALFSLASEALRRRLDALAAEAESIAREAELQRARLAHAEAAAERARLLRARDIGTVRDVEEAEADALDQAVALQSLERSLRTLARERVAAEAELAEAPLREAAALAETRRAIASLDGEIARAEADREVVLAAAEPGVVTAVQAAPGTSVSPDQPLLTMVPQGAALEARLYAASAAIGSVRPGQRVRLRYAAFPHQRFGQHEGVVRSVSRTTVGAAELERAGQALSGLAAGESAYRITVELASQAVPAAGEALPLQPDMQLVADVLIERRRLYQWVLGPLAGAEGSAS